MLDREKVKTGIFEMLQRNTWKDIDKERHRFQPVLNGALALLKEQEAVKPVVDIDTWKCGNCGHTLEHQELLGDNVLFHEQYNHCPECGKKVKWNA